MIFQKRGQLGKIISTFPVMILIFLVILMYLILAAFAYGTNTPNIPLEIKSAGIGNDVLLRNIKLDIGGTEKEIMIFDAIVTYWTKGEISSEEIENALIELVNKDARERDCLAIAQGIFSKGIPQIQNEVYDDYLIGYRADLPNNPARILVKLKDYDRNSLFRRVSFFSPRENKAVYVNYYYGRCLNE